MGRAVTTTTFADTAIEIAFEILDIMATHDQQIAERGYVDTPGGLEHMGDVWKLLGRWRAELRASKI